MTALAVEQGLKDGDATPAGICHERRIVVASHLAPKILQVDVELVEKRPIDADDQEEIGISRIAPPSC